MNIERALKAFTGPLPPVGAQDKFDWRQLRAFLRWSPNNGYKLTDYEKHLLATLEARGE